MLNDIESKRLRLNELTMKRVKAEKALLALNPRFPSWWQAKKRNRFKEELKAIDKDQKDALVAWEIAVKARQDLQDYRKGQRRSAQR